MNVRFWRVGILAAAIVFSTLGVAPAHAETASPALATAPSTIYMSASGTISHDYWTEGWVVHPWNLFGMPLGGLGLVSGQSADDYYDGYDGWTQKLSCLIPLAWGISYSQTDPVWAQFSCLGITINSGTQFPLISVSTVKVVAVEGSSYVTFS